MGGGALAAPPATTPAEEIFTVRRVAVDVTAENATRARDEALLAGQRAALQQLLQRLTLKREQGFLPSPVDSRLPELVKGIEVENEKSSGVRYLAELSVSFKPAAVRELLRFHGLSYAETPSKPVLVLPVYRTGERNLLWESPNPWLAAWRRQAPPAGLMPVILPLGDVIDIAAIDAAAALEGETAPLSQIADRYDGAGVAVTVATLRPVLEDGVLSLDLSVARYGKTVVDEIFVEQVAAAPGETVDQLLERAAAFTVFRLTERWKEDNLLRADRQDRLAAVVPLKILKDWVEVREKLEKIAFIEDSELVALSRREARVILRFVGNLTQLQQALAQYDLQLREGAQSWTLLPTGTALPVPGPAGSFP